MVFPPLARELRNFRESSVESREKSPPTTFAIFRSWFASWPAGDRVGVRITVGQQSLRGYQMDSLMVKRGCICCGE